MDFQKLLTIASKKQKDAEKELPQVKRYSTCLPPPKKAERPKVNPQAIKAIINKKEKTKQQEASEKDKKKQVPLKPKHETSIRGTFPLASGKDKKKQAPLKPKHGTSIRGKAKEKVEKTTQSKTDGSKKTLDKNNYKSKEHENKHKHFMDMIAKDAERKKERKESQRTGREETTKQKKQKPTKQPMNFKELMELAKRKQNGEVVIEKPTATLEKVKDKQHTSLTNSSSKKNNADMQKHEAGKKCKRTSDSKVSHDSTKVKLTNGQTKEIESHKKRKIITGSKMNANKVADITKANDVSNGKYNNSNLSKSSECLAKKEKTTVIGGKLKPKLPPQHRSEVNRVAMKRTAPSPKMQVKRGRICSDDEEEDDNFIDDSGEDVDVSKYIRQIFGYDKRNYGYESEYALNNMEASYSQIMKEETRSARLGMIEDIEDMKMEKMELDRKKSKSKR